MGAMFGLEIRKESLVGMPSATRQGTGEKPWSSAGRRDEFQLQYLKQILMHDAPPHTVHDVIKVYIVFPCPGLQGCQKEKKRHIPTRQLRSDRMTPGRHGRQVPYHQPVTLYRRPPPATLPTMTNYSPSNGSTSA